MSTASISARTPTLRESRLRGLGEVRRGKVRDSYVVGERRVLVASDRVSAFDVVFAEAIPHKGRVLTELTAFMTERARRIAPVAYEARPHPNVIVARECPTIPLEIVVRGYLAGSAWSAYAAGERVLCGAALPEGLRKHGRLPAPVVTPTTKAEAGHDLPITPGEAVTRGVVSAAEWAEIERLALALYADGAAYAETRGLVLVDTKYEFGRAPGGGLRLIDEIHTPDSSRYWRRAAYDANPEEPAPLSKELLRDWLRARGFTGQADVPVPTLTDEIVEALAARYVELCEALTGRTPDLSVAGDPNADVARALRAAGFAAEVAP